MTEERFAAARGVQPIPEMTRLRRELKGVTGRAIAAESEVDKLRGRLTRLTTERDRLNEQLAEMRASTTWRVGQAVAKPLAGVRQRLRRRR